MRKYFNHDGHADAIPSLWDGVYKAAVKGKERTPGFVDWWNDQRPEQRAIVFCPWLKTNANVFDNASAMLYMLQTLTRPQWDNGNPVIIDIFEAPAANRFNLDNLNTFKVYVKENWDMQGDKLLLRVNGNVWRSWCASSPIVTERLLEVFDVLLAQPGAAKPDTLQFVGVPLWWEYDWGYYKNDPTGEWATAPVVPPVIPPEPPVTGSYKITFHGIDTGLRIEPV